MAKRKTAAAEQPKATVSVGYFSVTLNGKTVEVTGTVAEVLEQMGRAFRGEPVAASGTMTVEQAAKFIGDGIGVPARGLWESPPAFQRAYRTAAKVMHPDAASSKSGEWDRLQVAAGVLKRHHGLA